MNYYRDSNLPENRIKLTNKSFNADLVPNICYCTLETLLDCSKY